MPTTGPDAIARHVCINVAAGIILNQNKTAVLIARRTTSDVHQGKWEFPGGKIMDGETPEQALIRELHEELGVRVTKAELFETLDYQYPHQHVNLEFFLVTDFSGNPGGVEGQTIRWAPVSELAGFDMLEANASIVGKLLSVFSPEIQACRP